MKTKGGQSTTEKSSTQRTLSSDTEDTEKSGARDKLQIETGRPLGAREWESDSDGGLGTSLFALLCGREVDVRPGFTEDLRRL
jgi:hypothetical protein